jgi:hypothetical protein
MIDQQGLYIKTGPVGSPTWQTWVGHMQVFQDGDNYTLRYKTYGNWYILEAHFDYGVDFDAIPHTPKSNNPIPGKFDWGAEFWGSPQTQVDFSLGPIPDGSYVFVAHAVVGYSTDGGMTFGDTIQTAWGDCHLYPSSKWAKYWIVTIQN